MAKDFNTLSQQDIDKLAARWPNATDTQRTRFCQSFSVSPGYVDRYLSWYRGFQNRPAATQRNGNGHGNGSGGAAPAAVRAYAEPPPRVDDADDAPDDDPIAALATGYKPGLQVSKFDGPLTIKADTVVLTSDWHIPRLNWDMWLRSLYVSRAINAEVYFLLGDQRDNNQPGMTPWPSSWFITEPRADTAEDMLLEAVKLTQQAVKTRVITIEGNHDRWIDRKTEGQYWFNRQLGKIPGVIASRLGYCDLVTSKGTWRLSHPKGKGGALLRLPRVMREKKHLDKNVAIGHTHKFGMGLNAGYYIMELGGLFEPDAMQYTKADDVPYEDAQPGFAFLVDGDPYMVTPQQDMRFYLGDKLYRQYRKSAAVLAEQMVNYYVPVQHIEYGGDLLN